MGFEDGKHYREGYLDIWKRKNRLEKETAVSCGWFFLTDYSPFCIFNPSKTGLLGDPSRKEGI